MKTPIFSLGGEVEVTTISGRIGSLMTLPISALIVDDTFQRAVSHGSANNIRRICREFDWAKFLPVIVVRDGEHFSVVDGQHRATAAVSIGIKEVPCYVLSCTPQEAASAFAAINGNVTRVSPVDMWFASLAANDARSLELKHVLDAANVTVTRRKDGHRVGETQSVKVLARAMEFYGSALLTTILQCITETGDGNPGLIVGMVINGIGKSIRTKPEMLADPSRIFDVFDQINLTEIVDAARVESARNKNPVQFIITRKINEILARRRAAA